MKFTTDNKIVGWPNWLFLKEDKNVKPTSGHTGCTYMYILYTYLGT